jgi:16S rRNA (guanine527-N7)-methyltransferase
LNEKFNLYMKLLLEWNEKINLTAITDPDEIVKKHFEDSLTCLKTGCVKENASVVDVGTGAGFPGVPIKIERDDIKLTLMDSLNKRINFLKTLCGELEIEADCIHARAEEAGKNKEYREQFDVAVSRAVANLSSLSEYCLPFVKKGGFFLAMKGKDIDEELNTALPLIERLGGKLKEVQLHHIEGTDITHSIVIIEKASSTPPKYPRNGKKVGTV